MTYIEVVEACTKDGSLFDPPCLLASGGTKKKAVGDTTSMRRKRRDFDAVYYMGVHNCSGEEIRALLLTAGKLLSV